MARWLTWIAGFAGVCASVAHAASFNCAKAQRPVEKLICSDAKLSAADDQLRQAYRAGLGRLPPAGVGPLRADQVQWLAWMQEICHAPETAHAATAAGSTIAPGQVVACMLPLYGERIRQLRGVAVERDGVRFLTRTQYLAAADPEWAGRSGPEFPGFGTLQATWPTAESEAPEWAAWNRAMEAAAYAMAAEDTWSIGKTAAKVPAWTPDLARSADTQITLHVKRVEHGRATSALSMETMGHGAAHPSESYRTITWLLQAQRPLRADDVFAPGNGWKKPVAEACWTALRTGEQKGYIYEQVTGPGAKELQAVISDTGNWTLEHDGLHISYPEYSVAPRVAPVDDTVIPWAALGTVLAKGFITP